VDVDHGWRQVQPWRFFRRKPAVKKGPSRAEDIRVDIPEHLDWFIWRPIKEGLCTFTEISTLMTINDLADAHDILDLGSELERQVRLASKG